MLSRTTGQAIPADTAHAVSVSLPTWNASVAYEEGQEWVLKKMQTGYPRFYVHKCISSFTQALCNNHGSPGEQALLFPSLAVASRCAEFLRDQHQSLQPPDIRILELLPRKLQDFSNEDWTIDPSITAVIYPYESQETAKKFWQHTGEGVSSRRAEFCYKAYEEGLLVERLAAGKPKDAGSCRGPKRYQKGFSVENGSLDSSIKNSSEKGEYCQFIEERFGRNLDLSFVQNAKLAIRRRIAGSLNERPDLPEAQEVIHAQSNRQVQGLSPDDVYLYPSGMNSIFNTHRVLLASRGSKKSICFGFPYIDTLKILQKWGPGCLFYGNGDENDLADLERRLKRGEKYLALFTEFPSNPLLKSPDIQRLSALASEFDFALIIDETVGNFLNIHVLPHADVVVSSLTKIFSGDCNVMGGSSMLNPAGRYYELLKKTMVTEFEDNYWAEDAIFMERNSRDFVRRNKAINESAEAVCDTLRAHPRVKDVYYPKYSPTRTNYEYCRNTHGGYGGLLSVTFFLASDAAVFFDNLETAKGPSLGTNFTLSCPYTILAHFGELDWAAKYGVEADLVRVSIGLEGTESLVEIFKRALVVVEASHPST